MWQWDLMADAQLKLKKMNIRIHIHEYLASETVKTLHSCFSIFIAVFCFKCATI